MKAATGLNGMVGTFISVAKLMVLKASEMDILPCNKHRKKVGKWDLYGLMDHILVLLKYKKYS
jgi:hypothetical protein